MVPFSHSARRTMLRISSEAWVRQLESLGLRILMVAVHQVGVAAVRQVGVLVAVADVPQTHMPVEMARHLHGMPRHEHQTRTQMAAKLPHGTHHHGHPIHTPMVVGLPLGTRPLGRRILTPSHHHGHQVLGGVVRHLHDQQSLVGRLG